MRKVVSWSLVLALTAAAVSAEPLDQPAFSASPAELLAAAKAVPADAAVTVLRNDIAIAVDARGRVERRERLVFAIRQAVGADDWGHPAPGVAAVLSGAADGARPRHRSRRRGHALRSGPDPRRARGDGVAPGVLRPAAI
jgi:hypothetical protein